MSLAEWGLVLGAVTLGILCFAVPMSRMEARAKDLGHGQLFASSLVLLVLASWPGYWLGMRILNRMHTGDSTQRGRN